MSQISFANYIGVSEGTVNRWCMTDEFPKYVHLIIDSILYKKKNHFNNEIFLNVSSSRTFILKTLFHLKHNSQNIDKTRISQMNSRLRSAIYQLNLVLDNFR